MVFTVYLCVIIPPFLYFPGRLHRERKQARLCRAYRPGLPGPFLLLKKSHTNHCSALLFGFIITWNTENRVKILENIRKTLDAFGIPSIIRIVKGKTEQTERTKNVRSSKNSKRIRHGLFDKLGDKAPFSGKIDNS